MPPTDEELAEAWARLRRDVDARTDEELRLLRYENETLRMVKARTAVERNFKVYKAGA